uniref:Uncharacterized protein n=1 Tax=Meloidogyne enterolobii TaxID=390850 RepID=A0A6V7WLD2_MELEN|nr:unnamed protein product [Meloidogyne enterolobii]
MGTVWEWANWERLIYLKNLYFDNQHFRSGSSLDPFSTIVACLSVSRIES